jgi:outer membrane protein TolC
VIGSAGRRRSTTTHRVAIALVLAALHGPIGCAFDEEADVRLYRDRLAPTGDDEGGARAGDRATAIAEPLGLAEALRAATDDNDLLAADGEAYVRTIIEKRRAAARFLPTIALAPSYAADSRDGDVEDGFDLAVSAAMLVNPAADAAALDASDADIAAALAVLYARQDALLVDVARTLYDIVRAERSSRVLEASLVVQAERVADARGRVEAGVLRPIDASLSESRAADTASELERARNIAANARVLLAYLTGLEIGERPIDDRIELQATLPAREELIATAEERRPERRASAALLEAARHRVREAYGGYFPSIAIDFDGFLSRGTDPTDLEWAGLVRVSLPLFTAGLVEADVRTALSEARSAVRIDADVRRAIARDIDAIRQSYASALERRELRRIQLEAARAALDQATGLYDVGLATNLERLTAQDEAQSAELALVNAELDAKVLLLELERTTGVLHERLGRPRSFDVDRPRDRASASDVGAGGASSSTTAPRGS